MTVPVPSTGAGDGAAAPEENPLATRVAAGPGAWEDEEWLADLRREPLLESLMADGTIAAAVRLEVDNTATATTKLWVSAPVSRGTVTVNGPAEAMNVTRVGQGVARTFSGTKGERIKAVVSGIVTSDGGCETLTLKRPSSTTVGSGSNCGNGNPIDVGPARLGKTGTYTALFQVDTVATGTGKLKITS